MKKISLLFALFLTTHSHAATETERARLEALRDFSLEDLQEVEIKLDDVFDVFGALVRDHTVSIATGQAQNASVAPAVTSVITAQDIEAMGARTLEEALRGVPGLHVSANPLGYGPVYSARGILSGIGSEMLLMINNVPIKSLNTGGVGRGWGGMSVAAIARVEVIRGPGSAVYGADAFSGAINIITKTAADIDGGELGIRLGSYNTYEGWALYGEQQNGLDLAATLDFMDSDGFGGMVETDAQTFQDQRFGTHASNAPGPVQTDQKNYDLGLSVGYQGWSLRGLYQQRRLGQGLGMGALPAANAVTERLDENRLLFDLSRQWRLSANWEIQGQMSYYQREFDSGLIDTFPPGALGGSYPEGMHFRWSEQQVNRRAEFSAFYHGFSGHSLRFGSGYTHENFDNFTWQSNFGLDADGNRIPPGSPLVNLTHTPAAALPEIARKSWFVYVQDTWNLIANWSITGGLRYDDYSDFGSTLNPRFALVHPFTSQLTGKLLYGSAFRSPSLEEQYIKNTGLLLGNPNIQPEIIDTLELVLDYRMTDRLYLNTNLFAYRTHDKIVRLSQLVDQTQVRVYQNAGEQTGKGLEIEARWKITPKSSLLANATYISTKDQNGDPTPRVPHQTAYLRADWLLGQHWFMDAQLNWVGYRQRVREDVRPLSPNYSTLDFSLRYKGLKGMPWDFAVGVRNLLNAEVRVMTEYSPPGSPSYIPQDLPAAEREWFTEIRYRF